MYKILLLISNFFQLDIKFYCEKRLWTHLDDVPEVEANKK